MKSAKRISTVVLIGLCSFIGLGTLSSCKHAQLTDGSSLLDNARTGAPYSWVIGDRTFALTGALFTSGFGGNFRNACSGMGYRIADYETDSLASLIPQFDVVKMGANANSWMVQNNATRAVLLFGKQRRRTVARWITLGSPNAHRIALADTGLVLCIKPGRDTLAYDSTRLTEPDVGTGNDGDTQQPDGTDTVGSGSGSGSDTTDAGDSGSGSTIGQGGGNSGSTGSTDPEGGQTSRDYSQVPIPFEVASTLVRRIDIGTYHFVVSTWNLRKQNGQRPDGNVYYRFFKHTEGQVQWTPSPDRDWLKVPGQSPAYPGLTLDVWEHGGRLIIGARISAGYYWTEASGCQTGRCQFSNRWTSDRARSAPGR